MSNRNTVLLGAAALLFFASGRPVQAGPIKAENQKIDRAVREGVQTGAATQSVIISVKPGYRETLRLALRQHGDVIKSEHPLIEAVAVQLHTGDLDELARQPWVEAISANAKVSAKGSTTELKTLLTQPTQTLSNSLRETLGLPRVATSATMTGATGISVAIIDSGIAPSDDFSGRITGFYDFTHGGVPIAPYDDYGHGTHVAVSSPAAASCPTTNIKASRPTCTSSA